MLRGSLPSVFLDTDVAFDIISKREPHFDTSVKVLQLASRGIVRLVISESSLANLFYLSFDIYKIANATAKLKDLVGVCEIIHAHKDSVIRALESDFKDKEDALQYFTALNAMTDYFVTRNKKDYRHKVSSLPVYLPHEFLELALDDKP